ncbi:hypothetical protein Agub_g10413 [Astrephomene gubernaculifera]|uniref:Uncharacterized protein n=1 Tax=Astrephomene gubernaculifera TaxID=47775 RepID=A0AAD3DXP1_9CHLO|nr:hypothetical protein Agub_g10413 [Astrephomene gubernaculifera]
MAHTARQYLHLALPLLLVCASWTFLSVIAQETAAQETATGETYDVYKEVEKLNRWKAYLQGEADKWKAEAEKAQAAWTAEQQRAAELGAQLEQTKKALMDAEARAAVMESRFAEADKRAIAAETRANIAEHNVAAAETRATAAEAKASAAEFASAPKFEQLKKEAEAAQARAVAAEANLASMRAELEQLRRDAAEAKAKATAHASAADASSGEAELLRRQLASAVSEREALESRVAELAVATKKSGGLRGHALAIYDILVDEAARHSNTALTYANEKLPGLKAKVAEVHATVSSQLPDVSGHVGQFVGRVDGELRPWLRQTLGSVPALKRYSEDPVVLQGTVYGILAAPLLVLVLVPLLTCCCRMARRPQSSAVRGVDGKPGRRGKKKQG